MSIDEVARQGRPSRAIVPGTTMRMGDSPHETRPRGAVTDQPDTVRDEPKAEPDDADPADTIDLGAAAGDTVTHGIASMVLNQCRSRVSLNGGTVGVVDSTSSSCSSGLPFKTVGPQPGEYQGVRFATRWLSASVAAISAHGEIDAFNASNLTEYALGPLRRCAR